MSLRLMKYRLIIILTFNSTHRETQPKKEVDNVQFKTYFPHCQCATIIFVLLAQPRELDQDLEHRDGAHEDAEDREEVVGAEADCFIAIIWLLSLPWH